MTANGTNDPPVFVLNERAPWALIVAALVLGVIVGAAFIHFFTEETTDAGNHGTD